MAGDSVNDSSEIIQTERSVRVKIIDNACLLFTERGYFGVSINDVAKKSALSKSSMYHYFPSKDDLVLAAIDRELEQVNQVLRETQGGIEGVASRLVESLTQKNGCLLATLAHELNGVSSKIAVSIRQTYEVLKNEVTVMLSTAYGYDVTEELAWQFIAQIVGAVMLSRVFDDKSHIHRSVQGFIATTETA